MIFFIDNPRPTKLSESDLKILDTVLEKIEEAYKEERPRNGRQNITFRALPDYSLIVKRWTSMAKQKIKLLRKAINKISKSNDYQTNESKKIDVKTMVNMIMHLENLLKEKDGKTGYESILRPINFIIEFVDTGKAYSGHSSFNKEIVLRVPDLSISDSSRFNKDKLKTLFYHELTHQKDPFLIENHEYVTSTARVILRNIYTVLYHNIKDKGGRANQKKALYNWASTEFELTARLAEWEYIIKENKIEVQKIVNSEISRFKGQAGGIKDVGLFRVLEDIVKNINENLRFKEWDLSYTKNAVIAKNDIDKAIGILTKRKEARKKAMFFEKILADKRKESYQKLLLVDDLKKIRKDLKLSDPSQKSKIKSLKSFNKAKEYVEDALDTYKLLFATKEYKKDRSIINTFSKALSFRIKEALENYAFDDLIGKSRYFWGVLWTDVQKITLKDLEEVKRSFTNQYHRYLDYIYDIMIKNGIKFSIPKTKTRRFFISKQKVEKYKENLKKLLRYFNFKESNNGTVVAQLEDIKEDSLRENSLRVDISLFTQNQGMLLSLRDTEKIKGLNLELLDIWTKLTIEASFPINVFLYVSQIFSDERIALEYLTIDNPAASVYAPDDPIKELATKLRYLKTFSKTERTIIDSLNQRFKAMQG